MAHKRTLEIKVNFVLREDEIEKLIHGIGDREWLALQQTIRDDIELENQFLTDPDCKTPDFIRGRLAAYRETLFKLHVLRTQGEKVPEEAEE
jgi:hypothetical protein